MTSLAVTPRPSTNAAQGAQGVSPADPDEAVAKRARRSVGLWLALCSSIVFAMLVLGGATRLSGSGLSIVEWQLVLGVLPPLSESAWYELFAKYQQSPQWRLVNAGMDLAGFKSIFWLEYVHRLVGRLAGFVFLLPFLYFLRRRVISRATTKFLALAFLLGALQGVVGWYMVKSGLADRPSVSQYRLALHLLMALVIYAILVWLTLDHLTEPDMPNVKAARDVRRWAWLALTLLFVTAGAGALVAGLHAGLAASTFPLMLGKWLPPGLFALKPTILNYFENVITVQFQHRVLATLTASSVVVLWFLGRRVAWPRRRRLALHLALATVAFQYLLGVLTILYHVPKSLALAHQATACVLLTLLLVFVHQTRRASTPLT